MRGRVTRVCAADPLTQQTANVRSRPVDGELMGWELIKSSPVSSHQSSCITMCWQLPPPPIRRTSLTQLLPNTHWFCFPNPFLVYFCWFSFPTQPMPWKQVSPDVLYIFLGSTSPTGFPPDHSPMSSSPSPGQIVPKLSVWALPHMRTEWTSHQPVFNGRTINTRQGETPLSTYKVTSVWPKAWQGPLSTYCLLWSITAQIISATQMGHIWAKSCFHNQFCFRFLIKWHHLLT